MEEKKEIKNTPENNKESPNQSFSYRLSSNFDDYEFEKDDDNDPYDSDGRKVSVVKRTTTYIKNPSPFSNNNRLGGFEDIVNKVHIEESEIQNGK